MATEEPVNASLPVMPAKPAATEVFAEQKVIAIKRLYQLIKELPQFSVSIADLQSIFVERSSEEFIDIFTHIVFIYPHKDMTAPEIMFSAENYLRQLDVGWPGNPEKSHGRRKTAYIFENKRPGSWIESQLSLHDAVHTLLNTSDSHTADARTFVRHFASHLLQSMYDYMTKDGYEKLQVLARLKWLKKRYAEEGEWWSSVRKRCRDCVGNKPTMTLKEFQQVFGLEDFIAKRLFEMADKNNDKEVDHKELFSTISVLHYGDTTQKLKFLFSIYDQNNDGKLDRVELHNAITACVKDSNLMVTENSVDRVVDLLFKSKMRSAAPEDGLEGTNIKSDSLVGEVLSYEELVKLLQGHSLLFDNLNISTFRSGLRQKISVAPPANINQVKKMKYHMTTNTSLWIFILIILLASLGIGGQRLYRRIIMMKDWTDIPLVVAKVCGQLLNFHLSLLMLFTCKHLITKLKQTAVRHYLPLDDTIFLHKMTAVISFILSIIHVIAHIVLIVFKVEFSKASPTYYIEDGRLAVVFVTGVALVLILVFEIIFNNHKIRTKSFSVFFISHLILAILWYGCLLPHAQNFIYWVIAPLVLFIMERIHFLFTVIRNRSVVLEGSTRDNVTFLSIKKPAHMTWSPGDYVIVNIPTVSGFDWRPFTISSSREGEITLHIRNVGRWTGRIYGMVNQLEKAKENNGKIKWAFTNHVSLYIDEEEEAGNNSEPEQVNNNDDSKSRKASERTGSLLPMNPIPLNWKVYMNGPFSSPSYDILNTEHAILVAGGIGVTPFVSVLESVVMLLKNSSKICPCGCEKRVWFDSGQRVKRIDFFWLTRSHRSLSWFVEIFQELEEEQISLGLNPPLVNVHLYLTGLLKETDMRGTFLQLALNTAYDEKSTDMLTGLRARTKPGRPDWNSVLPTITADYKSNMRRSTKPKLFACAPAQLCKDLKKHCAKLKINYKEEVFN